MLAMTVAWSWRRRGSFSLRKRASPTFSSPMLLSIPAGVSATRVGALPARGSTVTVFVTTPPSVERSTTCAYSSP
jgi:hypothetical protein